MSVSDSDIRVGLRYPIRTRISESDSRIRVPGSDTPTRTAPSESALWEGGGGIGGAGEGLRRADTG